MPELEIHHESAHAIDATGQSVGVLAAVLAVLLAIVTIASHRTHTAAIIHKANANDAWSYYQSTRVKYHNLELGENLLAVMGAQNSAADKMLADYKVQKKKYERQQGEISAEAQKAQDEAEKDEHHALRYDLGEGMPGNRSRVEFSVLHLPQENVPGAGSHRRADRDRPRCHRIAGLTTCWRGYR